MSKIAQIRRIVDETRELVDEVTRDLNEAVESYNLSLEEFRVAQESAELSTIDELNESLNGIEHLPDTVMEPEVVEENMEVLVPIEPPAPFEVEEPSSGMFGAKFFGFLAFLATLVAIVGAGAMMRHIDLGAITLQNWRQSLEEIFGFYSSFITGTPDAGAALGTVVALAVSVGVGYLVYWMLANSAAQKNLAAAKALFEAAKSWSEEQRAFIEKLRGVQEFLTRAVFAIRGCKVFGDEFAARVKRARFIDGDDFETMSAKAKEEVTTAQKLLAKLAQLSKLKLYAKEYEIAQSVRNIVDEGKNLVLSLKEKVYG